MAGEFSRSGRHYRSPTTDEALQGVRRPEDALSLIEKASFRIAGGSRFGGDDYMSPGGRSAELESLTELRPKNQATRNHVGLAMRPMSARSLVQIFAGPLVPDSDHNDLTRSDGDRCPSLLALKAKSIDLLLRSQRTFDVLREAVESTEAVRRG
jgi:hypothetical protein